MIFLRLEDCITELNEVKKETPDIKRHLNTLGSIEERILYLKDIYKGETAYYVTAGPSLGTHDKKKLNDFLSDKLVCSVKHSYDYVGECVDFHLLNTWNHKKTKYVTDNTIVVYALAKSYFKEHLEFASMHPMDIFVPVSNPPFTMQHQTTAATREFDNLFSFRHGVEIKWGPGLTYELAFPIPLLLGCKKIITIGWDIGDPYAKWDSSQHFVSDESSKEVYDDEKGTQPQDGELIEAIESTKEFYDWSVKRGIDIKIVSDRNPADKRFERITLNV